MNRLRPRAKEGWIWEWVDADPEPFNLPEFLAGFCVLVSLVIVVCVWIVVLTPAPR